MGSTALWDFEGILIPRGLRGRGTLRGGGWGEVQLVLSELSTSGLTELV